MDFSTKAPRGGVVGQSKYYLSQHARDLVMEFSGKTGIPMSRIVDNLIRTHMPVMFTQAEAKRIYAEAVNPRKRLEREAAENQKDFTLE